MDWIIAILLLLGSLIVLLAALGLVRLPDMFLRMHAATKSGSFGVVLILSGVLIYFGEWITSIKILLIVAFLFIKAPVASHLIARAGYFLGVSLWQGSVVDHLHGRYQARSHHLRGEPEQLGAKPVRDR